MDYFPVEREGRWRGTSHTINRLRVCFGEQGMFFLEDSYVRISEMQFLCSWSEYLRYCYVSENSGISAEIKEFLKEKYLNRKQGLFENDPVTDVLYK